jgi:hypothetical protein
VPVRSPTVVSAGGCHYRRVPQPRQHLLATLKLPSRYESLVAAAGHDVARLLVEPSNEVRQTFEDAAAGIRAQGRGVFAPLIAASGTGKSTLAANLTHWFGSSYAPTAVVRGEVSSGSLGDAVTEALRSLPASESRLIPIAIEDREFQAPTDIELTQIKSFLRSELGARSLVLWLETDEQRAIEISKRFVDAAGQAPVELPLYALGPPASTWPEIARNTLQLVNGLEGLEDLGVDPGDFPPEAARSLGDYLDTISRQFVQEAQSLLRATRKPIQLVVVFATQTDGPGILESFTGTSRFGGLEPGRLLSATPQSEVGRWWSNRRGLLTSVMYRLDTRALSMSPSTSVAMLRRFATDDVVKGLTEIGITRRSDAEIVEYLARSDLGKFVSNRAESMSETRGRPSSDAPAAFDLVASQFGFGAGRDKRLNASIHAALSIYNEREHLGFEEVTCEQALPFLERLIPDVGLVADNLAVCLEFHWRRREFLTTTHRSEIAQYILGKLRDYARALEWTSD